MKVALVSPYDYVYPGGVNNHVASLASELRRLGNDVTVVAPVARDGTVPDGVVDISRSISAFRAGGSQARICLSPRVSGRT